MIKMYNAEVLSKFPVVQHFPFGSLFSFDHDPNSVPPQTSIHTSSGPQGPQSRPSAPSTRPQQPPAESGTKAPWATTGLAAAGGTAAPWATTARSGGASTSSRIPPVLPDTSRLPPGPMAPTRAPWANPSPAGDDNPEVQTKAPWAK